jgi:hypothetical protein
MCVESSLVLKYSIAGNNPLKMTFQNKYPQNLLRHAIWVKLQTVEYISSKQHVDLQTWSER